MKRVSAAFASLVLMLTLAPWALAQPPGSKIPDFKSPEVSADRKITFRIFAPKAQEVKLSSSDIPREGKGGDFPGLGGTALKKNDADVWEGTVGPVPAGAYRYTFNVDGVQVIDPRNTAISETNTTTTSLAIVPGSDVFDTKDVPHGAVAKVTYQSKTLNRPRRAHVYTPPGYEKGEGKYPVFYLLHGASDCDASWSTVGRAGFILDNLIAAGKAKPMIVVMPHGHTGGFRFGPGGDFEKQMGDFETDFVKDLKPHVEANYRIIGDRANRAIAGLSMGGAQTLNIAFNNPNDYAYVGVFSSGIFGIVGGFGGAKANTKWEDDHAKALDDAELRKGLKLCWFACGKEDFLVGTSNATVDMLKKHNVAVTTKDTDGGHTWLNWRDYLGDFAVMAFQAK